MNENHVFIFIQDRRLLGGIETLELRVLNALAERGAPIIVSGRAGPLDHNMSAQIERVEHTGYNEFLRRFPKEFGPRFEGKIVTLVSLHPWALVVACILNSKLRRYRPAAIRGFHLVSHSRAFFFDTAFPILNRLLRRAFFESPCGSTYFMNDAARRAHAGAFDADLSAWPVLTLPLTERGACWLGPGGESLRIVSVGRLVPFKGYNRAAPSIVQNMRRRGIAVEWDIWGDGPDEDEIRAEIDERGVAEYVRLKGRLAYDQFESTVSGYDLFVGMGTALLEAAQLRMPAITSVENTTHECYGYLHQTPLDSVGDQVCSASRTDLEAMITAHVASSPEERANMAAACAVSATERSTDLALFTDAIWNARTWPPPSRAQQWWIRLAIAASSLRERFGALRQRRLAARPERSEGRSGSTV